MQYIPTSFDIVSIQKSSSHDLLQIDFIFQPVHNESGHYNTELFTEAAEKIIAGHNASTPLFLYVAHHAVHSGNIQEPLQAPQRLIDVR